MTEIPEHLLKRSKQRREAMGLGGEGGGDAAAAPAADAPAVVAQAEAPAAAPKAEAPVAKAPEAKPDAPHIAAAKNRRRIPYWAMPVLALLPVWAYMYYTSVQPPPPNQNDPLVVGAQLFSKNCSGCHGANGEGGSGPKLAGGEVLKTFANPLDQARWVTYGKNHGGPNADGTYGDKNRPGGQRNTSQFAGAMPSAEKDFNMTPDEVAAVVRHERETLSGEKTPAPGTELTGDKITAYLKAHPANA